jgi:hypothetical protein|tara:strand:- start:1791 stop:2528 length:738 start_codon:yes stop_codon:yes gene_type:complete
MGRPQSREDLKQYALRKLGAPVVDINVDDSQLEDRLDEAIQFFGEYHFDGIERVYLKHEVTQDDIDNEYFPVSDSVASVVRLFHFNQGTINMFDVRYQSALNDFYSFSSQSFIEFDIYKRHITMISKMLQPERSIRFNRTMNRVYVDMKWDNEVEVGDFILAETWNVLDPNTYTEIYDNILLKKYVTAQFKQQWGMNLMKFTGVQLPGGMEFNGRQLYDDGTEEINKLEEEVLDKYEEPPAFTVG